jgi:hypothetical protein
MLDLSPENFPNYRALLFDLAQLWTPPEPPPSTPPYTTTSAADLAATARRLAVELVAFAERAERTEDMSGDAGGAAPLRRSRNLTKRPALIDPSIVEKRWELWSRCLTLSMVHGHGKGKLSQRYFAARHNLNASEFSRWLSSKGRRGIPPRSVPDLNIRRALQETVLELENAAVANTHGASKIPNPATPFGPTMRP